MILFIGALILIFLTFMFAGVEGDIKWTKYEKEYEGIKIKGYNLKRKNSYSSGWYTWHLKLNCENTTDYILKQSMVIIRYKDWINNNRIVYEFQHTNVLTHYVMDLQLDADIAENIAKIIEIEIKPIFGKNKSEVII